MKTVSEISENFSPETYNKVALHPLQTWEWGEARKGTGVKILRFGVFENDALLSSYLMTVHQIPHTGYFVGYIPRSSKPEKEVIEYLRAWGARHNLIYIKFEPDLENIEKAPLIELGLIESPHPLFPEWTQTINLEQTEEELMTNMKPKTRYNIKVAINKGVTVKEESTDSGFEIFLKLYFETTARQKYHGHNPRYHQIVWANMKKNMAHIIIAYYEGSPLAAYELFFFKNKLYYPYGGSSDVHRETMASNLLMWETIKLGKKLGANLFDMWGSLPEDYDRNAKWSGFTRFKEGYGTSFYHFAGSFDLVLRNTLYNAYNLAHIVRKKYFMR